MRQRPVSTDRNTDVVVVGGGHNGLVCAWYLAKAGLSVEVIERSGQVGGACVTEELFPGYRVSAFAYVCWLLQPKIIRDMQLARHGFRYSQLDPFTFSPFRDGSHAVLWQDDSATAADLARLSADDARGYRSWAELMARAVALVYPFFLAQPPTLDQVWTHAKELGETRLLERLLTVPLAKLLAEHVEHSGIQAAMVSVNEIGDPWKPGSAWTETYFHLNSASGFGYAVVHGGMGTITQAMARSAELLGVKIRTGCEVKEILVDDKRALGVRTSDGFVTRADVVMKRGSQAHL